MLTRHPRALFLLLAVESLERFAFVSTLALLVLYLIEQHGIEANRALLICHLSLAASYLAGLPCGWLADRWLGHIGATLIGAALLFFGYVSLAAAPAAFLWPSLGLLVLAGGLFRTSITVVVGRLYEDTDPKRQDGFSALYIAVNIGYVAGPLYVNWAKPRWGWSWVVLSAAASMFVAALFLVAGWRWLRQTARTTPIEQPELDLEDRQCYFRILLLLYAAGVILSLCIQQGNGTLLLFAATSVQPKLELLGHGMSVSPELFVSFHGAAVLLLTLLGTWLKIWLRRRSADPAITTQLVWGFLAMTFAFVLLSALSPPVGPEFPMNAWGLVGAYVLISLGEALLAPLGMALVTRFALPHKAALVTSLWFLASALGVGLAGWLGLLWNCLSIGLYFTLLAVPPLAAGAAFLICTRRLEEALYGTSNP